MNSDTTNIRVTIDVSPEIAELLKRCAAALEAAERQVMQPEPAANVTFGFYGPGPRPGRKSEKPPMPRDVEPTCPTCSTVLEADVQAADELHWTGTAYCPNDYCPANQPHEASYDVEPIYDNALPRALRRYVVTERPRPERDAAKAYAETRTDTEE